MSRSRLLRLAAAAVTAALLLWVWGRPIGEPEPPRGRYVGCLGADVPGEGESSRRAPPAPPIDKGDAAPAVSVADPGETREADDAEDPDAPEASRRAPPPLSLGAITGVPITILSGPYAGGLEGDVTSPVWAADGTYLAYEVNASAGPTLVVAQVTGTVPGPALRVPGARAWGGVWLASPPLLLFLAGEPARAWFYAPGGVGVVPLPFAKGGPDLSTIAPSPDGSQVAVAKGPGALVVWTRAGGALASFDRPSLRNPVFSVDGRAVLYDTDVGGADVHRLVLATGEDTVVAGGPKHQFRAADAGGAGVVTWASDGARTWVEVHARGSTRVVAENVAIGPQGRPAVSAAGIVAVAPRGARTLALIRLSDLETVEIEVPLIALSDVAMSVNGAQVRVAFTHLADGERRLAIADISAAYADLIKK